MSIFGKIWNFVKSIVIITSLNTKEKGGVIMLKKLYDAHVAMDDAGDTRMIYSCMDELEKKIGENMDLELSDLLLDLTTEVERKGFVDGFKYGLLIAMECLVK